MGADAMLADRGEVAVNCEELDELRSLAASGSDSAELAQETADLIALLHQARSSNASVSVSKHVPEDTCTVCCLCSVQRRNDGQTLAGWLEAACPPHVCFCLPARTSPQ